jgi:C_GCAxxG_C_C family probable redox protein
MLLENVRKYYGKEYDLNCAETMLYAANDEYDLKLDKNALKTMSAFGGGMAIESVCGAVTGSLAALGIIFTKERAHESDKIKELSKEFFKAFEDKLQTSNCKELKDRYRNDEVRCSSILYAAAEALDKIVTREKENNLQ